MSVYFKNIPANLRAPFFYAEFQAAGTPYQNNARLLLIGQMTTSGGNAGVATANQAYLMKDGTEETLFGKGSMLAEMYKVARDNAPVQEIWCAGLADLAGGVKAAGTITVASAPPATAGLMGIWIAGIRLRVSVVTSDTNATIATKIAAAINAVTALPVTAVVNGGNTAQVDVTAKHKGEAGNTILMDLGLVTEEGNLGAKHLTLVQLTGGSGDPDVSLVLDNLSDEEFDWIAGPYVSTASMTKFEDFLNDTSGRWSYAKQLYGHYLTSMAGSVGTLSSFGNARNSQHCSVLAANKFRTPSHINAAALGAVVARDLQAPPLLSSPLQTVELRGVKGPLAVSDRLNLADQQTLLYDGLSTYTVDRAGKVRLSRVVTMYQSNDWGDLDATYLDIETMAQSMYGIRFIRQACTNQHGRKGLVDDNPGRVANLVTPNDIKATIIHAYQDLVALGVFENPDIFARDLIVERDLTDANRVNASMPLDHVNQLRILAVAAVNYMQRSAPRSALAA